MVGIFPTTTYVKFSPHEFGFRGEMVYQSTPSIDENHMNLPISRLRLTLSIGEKPYQIDFDGIGMLDYDEESFFYW